MYLSNHKRVYPLTKHIRTNYFITFIALMAVNPFFNTITNAYLLIFLVFLLLVARIRKVTIFNKKINIALLFVYLLIIVQGIKYDGFSIAALYFPLILIYIPFLLYAILGFSLLKYYINILYVISLITLSLWLLQSFIPAFNTLFQQAAFWLYQYSWSSEPRSLFFYTAAWSDAMYNLHLGIYRNSGLFHEPGAFGVFLIFGIIVNILLHGKYIEKKNIVFIICLLSTMSTTAYVGLFLLTTFYLFELKINKIYSALAVMIASLCFYQIYQNTEFLSEKINSQYENQLYAAENKLGKDTPESGRFYAFYTSLDLFLDHPMFGRGIIYATSEKASGEMESGGSYLYGITGIMNNYGFIGSLFFTLYFFRGFKRINVKKYSLLFLLMIFIIINLSLQTQVFINTIFFVYIFIIGLTSASSTILFIRNNNRLR